MSDGGALQPWQRPPFKAGNEAAIRHGMYSPKVVANVGHEALQLLEGLAAQGVNWVQEADESTLRSWAFSERMCSRLRAYVEGLDLGDRRFPAGSALLLQWERRRDRAADALGLAPLARARLGRDTAVAQAAAQDALRAVIDAGQATRPRLSATAAPADYDVADGDPDSDTDGDDDVDHTGSVG